MLKNRSNLYLLAILALMAGVYLVTLNYLQAYTDAVRVYVFNNSYEAATEFQREMLRKERLPRAAVPEHAIEDPGEIEGTFLKYGAMEGDIASMERFTSEIVTGSDLVVSYTHRDREGDRFFSIPKSDFASVDALGRGDRIDLLGIRAVQGEQSAVVLATNVKILDVLSESIVIDASTDLVLSIIDALEDGSLYACLHSGEILTDHKKAGVKESKDEQENEEEEKEEE